MSDSRHTKIDPRKLTLDPAMQARDIELIKDKRLRAAQEIKQEAQDKEILEDLRNGLSIRHSITVFVVNDIYYVVDGFHRTGACLKYLEETPDVDLKIPAYIIDNRTYQEAFATAQEANQSHGVGVTKDEIMQSKFRTLIVSGEFDLSVSDTEKKVGCSHGQAAHIARGLKACGDALAHYKDLELTNLEKFTEQLKEGLSNKYSLIDSAWDSKGFPKIRRLSDAITGNEFMPDDEENRERELIESNAKDVARLIERYDPDIFREGLRKAVRGLELGISVSSRKKWLEQAGAVRGSDTDYDVNEPREVEF
ncbi:hypothetical protein [uncultured Psychromonas sp.]|uniref:hypothetical protein n=1 Tax=uncultured Psychromonas sp. TaxID=173974 RepID=UPI0026190ECE|nr:hypothetical protein [uncultured Psychromonas sp.]